MAFFEIIQKFFNSIGIEIKYFFSGIFGGFVSLRNIKKTTPSTFLTIFYRCVEFLVQIISGALTASYLAPVICDMVHLGERAEISVGFIIGFGGIKIVTIVSNKLLKMLKVEVPKQEEEE